MKIRRATVNDTDSVLTLFTETIMMSCKRDYSQAQILAWCKSGESLERWQQFIEAQFFLVSELNGRISGFSSLDGIDYLDFMYVHPDYQRTGIALTLFNECRAEAKKRGAQRLISDVSITAKPFFERMGFEVIRSNRNLRYGETLINFRMELKVI